MRGKHLAPIGEYSSRDKRMNKLKYWHYLKWQQQYCIYCDVKLSQPIFNEHPNKAWLEIPSFKQRLYWITKRHLKENHGIII